jgi:hypothetical protein
MVVVLSLGHALHMAQYPNESRVEYQMRNKADAEHSLVAPRRGGRTCSILQRTNNSRIEREELRQEPTILAGAYNASLLDEPNARVQRPAKQNNPVLRLADRVRQDSVRWNA